MEFAATDAFAVDFLLVEPAGRPGLRFGAPDSLRRLSFALIVLTYCAVTLMPCLLSLSAISDGEPFFDALSSARIASVLESLVLVLGAALAVFFFAITLSFKLLLTTCSILLP